MIHKIKTSHETAEILRLKVKYCQFSISILAQSKLVLLDRGNWKYVCLILQYMFVILLYIFSFINISFSS